MSDYNSGYDPKYGYNRNAFAHKTVGTAIMGRVVKMVVTPIGLVSEAIHAHRDKRRPSVSLEQDASNPQTAVSKTGDQVERKESAYVEVPPEVADELIASGQAEAADTEVPTHELIEDEGIGRDEADWALDEAAAEGEDEDPASSSEKEIGNPKEQADKVATKRSTPKLPFPVILPQRRPGTKARGFVRAYSPILEESGISQDAFLGFLKDLHKATQASPIFDVVMIATALASAYPDPVIGLGIQAVQVAVGIGQEIQERYRTNKFLTQANKEFFIPKGLYAMIVTYKTGGSEQPEVGVERVDLGATAVAKYAGDFQADSTAAETGDSGKPDMLGDVKEKMKQFRVASGETRGEAEMPVTCAPLIFPALDAAAAATAASSPAPEGERNSESIGSNIKAKSKSASKFVNDYYDRRAQASYVCTCQSASFSLTSSQISSPIGDEFWKYLTKMSQAYQNPESTLTTQVAPTAPKFRSCFADPNNQTNMHFFTLITGGRYKAEP